EMRVHPHAPLQREITLGPREHALGQLPGKDEFGVLLDFLLHLAPRVPEMASLIHNTPLLHARPPLQAEELVRTIDNANRLGPAAALDGRRNDGLVLDGVHAAGGVYSTTADLEHLQG